MFNFDTVELKIIYDPSDHSYRVQDNCTVVSGFGETLELALEDYEREMALYWKALKDALSRVDK